MKKFISVFLVLTIIFSAIPVCGAIDVSTKGEVLGLSEDVYYTDLFSVYSGYMSKNMLLDTMNTETQGVLIDTYNTFKNSDEYDNMLVATAFEKTGIADVIKLLGDGFGISNFTYNEALDEANERFLNYMFGSQAAMDTFGAEARYYEYFKEICVLISNVVEKHEFITIKEFEALELVELIGYTEDGLDVTGTKYLDETVIREVYKYTVGNLDDIEKIFEVGTQGIVMLKAIYLACITEMIRADIIDDLLESATPGTALYDGMKRLKAQMGDDITQSIIKYYFENGLLKKLLNAAENWAIDQLPGAVSGTYNVITLTLKVVSLIVFDLILDTPKFSEVTSFIILGRYANDLYTSIRKMENGFPNTCLQPNTITRYENLWCIYMAVNKAAWYLGKNIARDEVLEKLNFTYEIYFAGDHNLYSAHINYIIEEIEKLPVKERTITSVDCYKYVYNTVEYQKFGNSTDKIEKDTIYGVNNMLYGNMVVSQRQMIPSNGDRSVLDGIKGIWGNLSINGHTLYVPKGTELVVGGNVLLTGYWNAGSYYEGVLSINGRATVLGDVYTDVAYTMYDFYMSDEGELWLYGDFNAGTFIHNYGTIYCVGEEQQGIGGEICNLVVYNPEGIKGDISLNGRFDLCGNPFEGIVYLYEGGSFADGSNYKDVRIQCTKYTMRSNIPADSVTAYGTEIMISKGESYVIGGDLYLGGYVSGTSTYKGVLNIYGELTINGDISRNAEGNNYYEVRMSDKDSLLRLKGDQNIGISTTGYGLVVFSGDKQQKISGNHNDILVLNEEGVAGDISLYGYFALTGKPHEGTVMLRNGGAFDDSRFDRVSVENNNCTLKSNINAKTLEIYRATLTVPAGESYTIGGDIILGGYMYGFNTYYGILDVKGDLSVKGDISNMEGNNYYKINFYNGSVIRFSGSDEQRIKPFISGYTVILENESDEGVIFESGFSANTLFDHNRNNYVINGTGIFTDYDKDGISDSEDMVPEAVKGDVDCDGSMNALDSFIMSRMLVGRENNMSFESKYNADFNDDGAVNSIDSLGIKRKIVGA